MINTRRMILVVAVSIMFLPVLSMSGLTANNAQAGTVDLPKTGHTVSYSTGDDGDLQKGVAWPTPRFADNGNGTVTDNLTGLMWLKDAQCFVTRPWSIALSYANALADGQCGLTDSSVAGDWRLPNVNELESLINAGESNPAAWLNSQGFINVGVRAYWSSTTVAGSTSNSAWYVNMWEGFATSNVKTYIYQVWPVRAVTTTPAQLWKTGQTVSYSTGDDGDLQKGVAWPTPRFADNGNGTVTDNLTGLMWLKNANCFYARPWSDSLSAANALAAGQCGLTDSSVAGDWRLPNRKELHSLTDYSQYSSGLPSGHPFTNVGYNYRYWSSTTKALNPASAWYVSMWFGVVNPWDRNYPYYIWPVRAGEVSVNQAPVADAGSDETFHAGTIVTLDGSGSSDPDSDPITYSWQITSVPAGSTAALSDATVVNPSFIADVMGDYTIELVVTDSFGLGSAPDIVIISTSNTAPVADAGPDQSATELGTTIQLDSQSWDPDGDPITYSWTMSITPAGSTATLSDATSSMSSFVPDVYGDYVIELVVDDMWVASAPDTVTISFANVKPIANAGGNQSVGVGDMVSLDGSGSSDDNGDPLTYNWSLVSTPAGSTATLSDATSSMSSFVADVAGTYVVNLVVNDGFVDSDPNNVTVTATSTQNEVIQTLDQSIDTINNLDPGVFKNRNMPNSLTNKINAVLEMIDQGLYQDALDKLENDILKKTNGCAESGSPDKNDWIKSCTPQEEVYPLINDAIALLQSLIGGG